MQRTFLVLALVILAGCERNTPAPPAPPPTPTEDSVELKLDTENGAVEFKKEEGSGGDDVDVEVKTE